VQELQRAPERSAERAAAQTCQHGTKRGQPNEAGQKEHDAGARLLDGVKTTVERNQAKQESSAPGQAVVLAGGARGQT